MHRHKHLIALITVIMVLVIFSGLTCVQASTFVAPPRTIADITAILNQEKPDPERIAKMHADADASPPQNADADVLIEFYYNRAIARSNLGRFRDSIADLKEGIALGLRTNIDVGFLRQVVGFQYNWSGENKKALDEFLELARESEAGPNRNYRFSAYRWISFLSIGLGDLDQAERYLRKSETLLVEAQSWSVPEIQKRNFRAQVEYSRGRLFEAHGNLQEAEAAYRRAEILFTEVLGGTPSSRRWNVEVVRDNMIASQGVVKAKQGRYAEAEADARRALLNRLGSVGKYNLMTATVVLPRFASVLLDQGRYGEAEKLVRTQQDIYDTLGVAGDSQTRLFGLNNLASLQALQEKWSEAAGTYAAIDKATESWDAVRKARLVNVDRVLVLYNTDHVSEGLAAAKQLLAQSASLFGQGHIYTAYAQAAVAVGFGLENHTGEALEEFRRAIPIILSAGRDAETDDVINAAAHEQRTRMLIESYMSLLARSSDTVSAAVESFPLADAIRGHSVQLALTLSGARAVAATPKLASLARREQDLAKQIAGQFELLNALLARPREQRDESVRELQSRIDRLRAEHATARNQVASEFPTYAGLIDPKPPSVDAIRNALKPDEAFISFYFGSQRGFAWVIAPDRPVIFATIDLSAGDVAAKVKMLRSALDPQVALISEMPQFDVALAHDLYRRLLQPVEAGWKQAERLVVVTNGALGELPLGLLPTAPSLVDQSETPMFSGYRNVPWLARTHAVTTVPSAAAFLTLRRLPPGPAQRDKLIGFGDPYFNNDQAAEAEAQQHAAPAALALAETDVRPDATTRSVPIRLRASPHTEDVDTARLAMLPRLPDTRDELIAVARALDVDPGKALYLGKEANEQNLKTIDLAHYGIVAFATHGLVPGDLDGLTQPALALAAPDVAGVDGDGLLTMEKILALKLDADWVLLSACNTAAGAGAGAEAASGLARAFFYAGTRAVLVTNWPVHSTSARELVSDLFRRQAADPKLTRDEALRQSMMALLDSKGFADSDGNTLFSYAHPLFWAPYIIIGDGG
jgi:CHAT domain-containing protein